MGRGGAQLEREGFVLGAVPHPHLVALLQQVLSHRVAHRPCTSSQQRAASERKESRRRLGVSVVPTPKNATRSAMPVVDARQYAHEQKGNNNFIRRPLEKYVENCSESLFCAVEISGGGKKCQKCKFK